MGDANAAFDKISVYLGAGTALTGSSVRFLRKSEKAAPGQRGLFFIDSMARPSAIDYAFVTIN
jgi:hypothetical protein